MDESTIPILRDASESVEDLALTQAAATTGVAAAACKPQPLSALSDLHSESPSLRTPPISNGPSESGREGSAQPASHSYTNASSTSLECALAPGDLTTTDGAAAAAAEASAPRREEPSLVDDSTSAGDDDAPPPLTLCTMKAASHTARPATFLGPASPFLGTPLRAGHGQPPSVPSVAPLRAPSSPAASPSSSPRAGPKVKGRRRSSNKNTATTMISTSPTTTDTSKDSAVTVVPLAHRPGLSVYAPQYRRLRGKVARSHSRKSDASPSSSKKAGATSNSSGSSSMPQSTSAAAMTQKVPTPPPTSSTTSASPSAPLGRRSLSQRDPASGPTPLSQRTRATPKTTGKHATRGGFTAAGAHSSAMAITPITATTTPTTTTTTSATSAMAPQTPLGLFAAMGTTALVNKSGSLSDGASPATSTRTDCLAVHAIPLSVSGRTTTTAATTTASTSFGGLSSHGTGTDTTHAVLVGDSGSFSSPIGTLATGTSHLARPLMSTVFCRELSTSLGGGAPAEPVGPAAVRLGGFPQLGLTPATAPTSANAGKHAVSTSNSSVISGRVQRGPVLDGNGLTGDTNVDDSSQPPSWTSPRRTRLSPCRPPSAPHFADDRALFSPAATQTSSDNYDQPDTDDGPPSACARLPSVLVARGSGSGRSGAGLNGLMDGPAVASASTSVASTATLTANSPPPSHYTQGSSATSAGQITPRPAGAGSSSGAPSEFVLRIQQQQQLQRSQHGRSEGPSAHSGYSPRHVSPAPALPLLKRNSHSQNLLMTPGGAAPPSAVSAGAIATARPSPGHSHNYSLSPHSPGPVGLSGGTAPLLSPLFAHRGLPSAISTSNNSPTAMAAHTDDVSGSAAAVAASASQLSVSVPSHVPGSFSMAGRQRASRTGSGLGASLLSPTATTTASTAALPLTLARVAAHTNRTHTAQEPLPVPSSATDRTGRPPLPTSTLSRGTTKSPVPVSALSGLRGALSERFSRQSSEAGSVTSGVGWRGGGLVGDDERGSEAYRSLFYPSDGSQSPTHGSSPSPRRASDGVPQLTDDSSASPLTPPFARGTGLVGGVANDSSSSCSAQNSKAQTLMYVEPHLPSTPSSSRPGGARYRHGQLSMMMEASPH